MLERARSLNIAWASVVVLHIAAFALYSILVALPESVQRLIPEKIAIPVEAYMAYVTLSPGFSYFSTGQGVDFSLLISVERPSENTEIAMTGRNREVSIRFTACVLYFINVQQSQELLARSLAARVFDKYPDATRVTIRAIQTEFPTMAAFVDGDTARRNAPFFETSFVKRM